MAELKELDDKEFLEKVSSLMLDGWKMLGITCPSPSCKNCALLRDKEVSSNEKLTLLSIGFIFYYFIVFFLSDIKTRDIDRHQILRHY